jgi:hypothetical protein
MRRFLKSNGRSVLACGLAAMAVFAWAAPAQAQTGTRTGGSGSSFGGGSGGSSFGGGSGGSSSFGGGSGGSSFGGGSGGGSSFGGGSGGGSSFGGGGSSFSGGGTSFAGGGTNFSGGGTNFSGGGTSVGGGGNRVGTAYQGGAGGRGSTSSSYTYPGVATSNPFSTYYASPLAAGLAGSNGRAAAFGAAVYTNNAYGTATTTTGSTAQRGTTGLNGGYGTNSNRSGSSSGGMYVPPLGSVAPYDNPAVVRGSGPLAMAGSLVMRPDLRNILANTSRLSQQTRDGIQVRMEGQTVVIQGFALDGHEGQVAEAMLRMTPGVSDVRNEMQLRGSAPTSPGGP